MELSTRVAIPKPHRIRSINKALTILGAKESEIYAGDAGGRRKEAEHRGMGSIYAVYSIEELIELATDLYKDAMKKYHPDLHPRRAKFYTEKCKLMSEAYVRALQILLNKKFNGFRKWRH